MKAPTTDAVLKHLEQSKDTNLKKEVKALCEAYEKQSKRINKVLKQSDAQQHELQQLNHELQEYKTNLEERVKAEIEAHKEKDKILFQQSKMAALGELIEAVSNHWNEPLNAIDQYSQMLIYDYDDDLIDLDYVKDYQKNINDSVSELRSSLHEFKSFFSSSKEKKKFSLNKCVESVLVLLKDELKEHEIHTTVDVKNYVVIEGIENEIKHLIINIINNSKEAFHTHKTQNRKISFIIDEDDRFNILEIIDNAGGVSEDLIETIFKPSVSTKDDGKGIGLYMSTQIALKHKGILSAYNVEGGIKMVLKMLKNEVID